MYGPRDNPRKHDFSTTGNLTCTLQYAPFARRERRNDNNNQDTQSKEYSNLIRSALHYAVCLEEYPKAQIDIYVNVIEENGDTLSHAIMAASIALADAGIRMLDIVTACSLVFNEDNALLDPAGRELTHRDVFGSVTVAYLPSLNQVCGLVKRGEQDVDESIRSINTCIEGCLRVHSVMKDCLLKVAMVEKKT